MSELSKKDSDSDVDSNSSWTLLTEDANGDSDGDGSTQKNKQEKENVIEEPEKNENTLKVRENELAIVVDEKKSLNSEVNRENDVESLSSSSICSLDSLSEIKKEENSPEQGCLTLNEYLTDRELAHDYDYDNRAEFWEYLWNSDKRKKRKYKKCKEQNLTTMSVIGAVLSLAGLSLLCLISPILARNAVTPDIQTQVEKNFTRIETPYANENNLKVYIDKSNEVIKLIDNIDILSPHIQQCCSNHLKNTDCEKACPRNGKANHPTKVKIGPNTRKQFENEKVDKDQKKTEVDTMNGKELPKSKYDTTKGNPKKSEDKKGKTNKVKYVKSEKNIRQNHEKSTENKENKIWDEKATKKSQHPKKQVREYKIRKILGKSVEHVQNNIDQSKDNSKCHFFKKDDRACKKKSATENKQNSITTEKYGSFQNTFRKIMNTNVPNFILVNKAIKTQSKVDIVKEKCVENKLPKIISAEEVNSLSKDKTILSEVYPKQNKLPHTPSTEKADNIENKCTRKAYPKWLKSATSLHATLLDKTSEKASDRRIFLACQILQDLVMLRLTSKLRAKEKYRQKKLKRRLDRKNLRAIKTEHSDIVENEEGQQNQIKEKKNDHTLQDNINKDKLLRDPKLVFHPPIADGPNPFFKPKLVDNHFVTECKPIQSSKIGLSNFDLLKELPFMTKKKMEGRECIIFSRPKSKHIEKVTIKTYEPISFNKLESNKVVAKAFLPEESQKEASASRERFVFYNQINRRNSAKFLEDARRKHDERLKTLEKMKQDNRLKIDEIIRERRERLKKDASLGIYNVPLPQYTEISEKLKQLKKRKAQQSFFFDAISSSDSESEQRCTRSIPSELMTALRMGKKVSDTFKEWTIKKAPTLTCLKNYCNSKVSQISERLSSQSMNQTNILSSINKEELEALKCRREKHEQLKKFWKAKQDYLDKRIEICKLLKKKLSTDKTAENCMADQNITQGVQILDSIINDVLKSIRNSKSHVDNSTCHRENEAKTTSKSVGNIIVKEDPKEKNLESRRIETFSANSDELYNWLFERRAMEIRNRDKSLWNVVTRAGHVERKRDISKHNPAKGYHEKILKKHN